MESVYSSELINSEKSLHLSKRFSIAYFTMKFFSPLNKEALTNNKFIFKKRCLLEKKY